MNDHSHPHDDHGIRIRRKCPMDAGSQALTEALRSSFAIVRVVMFVLVAGVSGVWLFQSGTQ